MKNGLLAKENYNDSDKDVEDLMHDVREKLDHTPAIQVAGISSESTPVVHVKEKRIARKTFGKEITCPFRTLLILFMTGVVSLSMIAQLLTQILISLDVYSGLVKACNESSIEFLNSSYIALTESVILLGKLQMEQAKSDIVLVVMQEAQAQVGTFYNFIKSANLDPVLFEEQAQTTRFITRQINAEFTSSLDIISFGEFDNAYNDAAYCHQSTVVAGNCGRTIGYTINSSSTFERCNITVLLPSDYTVAIGKCVTYYNFSVRNQVPYQDQLRATLNRPDYAARPAIIWSEPYQVQNFFVNIPSSNIFPYRYVSQKVIAVAASYPIFASNCSNSSITCLPSVVWAPLTSRSIAEYSLERLSLLYENVSIGFRTIQNDSAFFVVDGRLAYQGTLLGGSWVNDDGRHYSSVPSEPYPSKYSTVHQIRDASNYLLSLYGSFGNPVFDRYLYVAYNPLTMSQCNFTRAYDESINCTMLFAIAAYSLPTEPAFRSLNQARFVIVYSFPISNVLTPYVDQFLASQNNVNLQRIEEQEALLRLITIGIAIAILCIAIGLCISCCVAVRITVPLKRLEQSMRRLIGFQFTEGESEYFSRVEEIRRAENTLESLESAIEVFAKFVPETVVKGIVQGKLQSIQLHVSPRIVTVAFSDIRGFTSISEKLEVSDLLYFLTRYLTVMTTVVENYDGVVTEILGDGLLVLWNAPDDCHLHAAKACAAALAMQIAVKHLSEEFKLLFERYDLGDFSIRVGIHTGQVLAGNIGSRTKLKYGCLGDTVNTASRLEGLCKLYGVGVICSQATFDQLPPERFRCRELDLVQVKGKDKAVALYEVRELFEKVNVRDYMHLLENEIQEQKEVEQQRKLARDSRFLSFKNQLKRLSNNAFHVLRQSKNPKEILIKDEENDYFGPIQPFKEEENHDNFGTDYENALRAFQAGDFELSLSLLEPLAEKDVASSVLLVRVKDALSKKEELDMSSWTGVNRLTEKF